jgi:hypothetical protein
MVMSDVVGGVPQCGMWMMSSGKTNVEISIASVKRWNARSTLDSMAGLLNAVSSHLMCLQQCVLLQQWVTNECCSQASQAKTKFYLRVETCALRKSTSLCLLAIPAFDHIAGLSNTHLNSNWGMCLC